MPVLAVRGAEPNPLTPFPVKEGGTEKIWGDDRNWMRRLGTGTGFAGAKLSEVVARSERSLASVRMTEKSVSQRVRAT